MGTTFLQSPIISILRTPFVLKIAVFLQFVILEQIILHFHSFHKYFNHFILSSEDFSTQIVTKIEKRLFFPTKTAFYVWKTPWRTWNFRQKNRRQRACGQMKKEEMMIKEGGLTGNSTIQFPVIYYIIEGPKMVNKL